MGISLWALLAEAFTRYVENLAQALIEDKCLYKRYVDDILVIFDNTEGPIRLWSKLDNLQGHISVSYEEEMNKQLPLLGIHHISIEVIHFK